LRAIGIGVALALVASATPALAAGFGIEASSDLRRRGLSWSDGKPALEAWASVPVAGGVSVEAGGATLRGSTRHGGADLLAEAALRYTLHNGNWSLWAEAGGLGFVGADDQSYAQLRTGTSWGLGPLQIAGLVAWAPPQRAIGGSNLYLNASASIGIPATPLTLRAAVGRSMGSSDGSGRANRLRPGGDYGDVRLDLDYGLGPLTLGASLTTTSIDADRVDSQADDFGTRFLIRALVSF
jgi:hypothetical protein